MNEVRMVGCCCCVGVVVDDGAIEGGGIIVAVNLLCILSLLFRVNVDSSI